jgi:segregation and condensation protein A
MAPVEGPAMPETAQGFLVELPVFSGPFRLLTDLILDQKVDVCDVPVARITERFARAGAEEANGWSLEEATWFLAVCALLLELKVGRLLPRASAEAEEDLLGGVSPDLLYARSLELAAFRKITARFSEIMAEASLLVPRSAPPPPEFAHLYPDVMDKVTPEMLLDTAVSLLEPLQVIDLTHVTPIRASLSEALRTVEAHVSAVSHARFRDLLQDCEERIHVVVRFLALLELYREGKVELLQAQVFGDIEVRWRGGAHAPGEKELTAGSEAGEALDDEPDLDEGRREGST